ncbi:MAG: hypothetical protein IH934_02100 [Nanoarchaeota archaeon]|nr:hypothetical protein [Nanoarchaeota archaeon]
MKQKNGVILLVFGIVLLLFIAGCDGKKDVISRDSPFVGGTKGLEIKFLKDAPPSEITDNNLFPFKVVLSITNEGEFDGDPIELGLETNRIRVDLKGFLPDDFGVNKGEITNINPEDNLIARKKDSEGNIIEPVEVFVTIPQPGGRDLKLGENKISANTEFTFRVDICYQYGSDAIAKICILENMIAPADDAICNPREGKRVFSSSSPVRVTSFRQTVAGENKIQFSFDIEHSGPGKVFKNVRPTSTTGCPKDLGGKRREENKVEVTVKTGLGSTGLSCVGLRNSKEGGKNGEVTLVGGKRTITCTQEIAPQFKIDLEKNVDIELRFDYSDSVDRKVLAKHIEVVGPPTEEPPIVDGELNFCGPFFNNVKTFCRDGACSDFGTSCTGTDFCKCAGTLTPCAGTCPLPTDVDDTGPRVGDIEPEFAIAGSSQVFVIQDVFDTGSGVTSCRFTFVGSINMNPVDVGGIQGPVNCDKETQKCDFWESVSIPEDQGDFQIHAECTNGAGIKNTDNIVGQDLSFLTVRVKKPDDPGVTAGEKIDPVIGDLVINIATIDQPQQFLVVGIQDEQSGIKRCELVIPNYQGPQPGVMILQGPLPCFGKDKVDKEGKEGNHGSCSAIINFKIESKNEAGGTIITPGSRSLKVVCEDRAGNTKTTPSLPITLLPQP